MARQTLVITGVNGFIGSHAAQKLKERFRIIGIDTDTRDRFAACDAYCQLLLPDPDLETLLRTHQPLACLHFAGSASVPHSLEHPANDFKAGPVAVFHLVDALRKSAPKCILFFPSSAAVYGNPTDLPIGEDAPLAPVSPYGFHKLICEQIIQEFTELYGVHAVVLRIFSCYGTGLRKQLLWDACQKIHAGEFTLFGSGKETRDFIHVHDVVSAIDHLLTAGVKKGVFNVASGTQTSVAHVAQIMATAYAKAGVKPSFTGKTRCGDPLYWQADVRALARTGFIPKVSLEQGIIDYVTWFKEHIHG